MSWLRGRFLSESEAIGLTASGDAERQYGRYSHGDPVTLLMCDFEGQPEGFEHFHCLGFVVGSRFIERRSDSPRLYDIAVRIPPSAEQNSGAALYAVLRDIPESRLSVYSGTDAGEAAEGVAFDSVTSDQWSVIHEAAHDSAFGERSKKTPTPAQCEAGNYKLGRAKVLGFHVAIETPKGAYRRGVDKGGRAWETQMPAHYGYLSGTTGADGDAVDCFVGSWPDLQGIYVVNQWLDGRFDEHKVMFGFIDEAQARSTYLASYSPGWQGLRDIVPVTPQQLRTWLRTGNLQKPLTSSDLPPESTSMDRVMWCGVDPIGKGLAQVLYGIRAADADDGLLLDSLTDEDLAAEFEPGDVSFDSVTLDAITIESRRIEGTGKALMRALKAQADGVTPVDFVVSKPRMMQGVLNVTLLYKLSDGQTLTIFFNNPDATPRRLKADDVLVSWKWLLNRKDVTIVVAPERGRDLNLSTVALRVMALAEKNSAAFTVAQAAAAAKDAVIAELKDQIKAKQDEFEDIERQIAAIKAGGMVITPAPARVELTGGELGEFDDSPEGVRALRDAALNQLESMRDDWVPCGALQALVQIRKSTADKIGSLSHDPRKLKAVAKIREIIAAAKKVKETAPYAPAQEQNVRAYFLMRSEIVLNGDPLAVRLVFKQDDKGKFHWDHTIHSADATFDSAQEKGPSFDGPDPMATSNGGGVAGEPVKPDRIGDSHQPGEDVASLDSGGQGDLVLNLFIEGEETEPAVEPVAVEPTPEPVVVVEPVDEPNVTSSDVVSRAEETAKILIGRGWSESQAAGDPMTKDSNGQGYSVWLKDAADPDSFYALIETQGAFHAEVGGGPDRSPTEIADLIDAAVNNSGAVPAPEPEPEPILEPAPAEPALTDADLLRQIAQFIGPMQMQAVRDGLQGEEAGFFRDKLADLVKLIGGMPSTGETDGKGDSALAYLHYFKGGSDWYIAEKDRGNGPEDMEQTQAYGYAILNGDKQNAEMGYISIVELTTLNVELDFHFEPKALSTIKGTPPAVEQPDEDAPGIWKRDALIDALREAAAKMDASVPEWTIGNGLEANGVLTYSGTPMPVSASPHGFLNVGAAQVLLAGHDRQVLMNHIQQAIEDQFKATNEAAKPAPADSARDAAKQFLLDAKAGALDFNDPAMTEKLEAAYTPFADDPEIAELFNDAVNAFVDFETARSATIA